MANSECGVGNIDFAALMQEVETLGVDLPVARRPGVEVREEEAGPFGEGVRAVSDFCYAAGAQGEARPTPGECELHFNLAFVYGPEHVRKLYEAILGQTEALGYPGDWPREAGDSCSSTRNLPGTRQEPGHHPDELSAGYEHDT